MSHPLEEKIGALRRRLRRLLIVYGVSWVVAAVVGTIIVVGLTDYLIRFQDRGLRVICSLLVLGALGWTGYRYLYLALSVRLRHAYLAGRLQRRFPVLEDRLVSSVEFLGQSEDDPTAGSPALRRAVIAQTTADAERLDFSEVMDRRLPIRATITTVGICLAAAILIVVDPLCCGTAVARLANPFGNRAWPQKHHLQLRHPVSRVARGQAFEVEVIDADGVNLPSEVRIHYRSEAPDGTASETSEPIRLVGASMVARRENVVRPFSYRVEGGDDDSMPWMPVEVVDPPEIESLSVELIPPVYTGWPVEKTDQHVRALVGTRMRVTAKATKALQSALFCMEGDGEMPVRVSRDGYRLTLPAPNGPRLVMEKSGAYWFRMTDREGLMADSTRGAIRAVGDAPPTVLVEQPTANVYVTARAEVPLRVVAKDDLAIHRVALVYGRSEQAEASEPRLPLDTVPLDTVPLDTVPLDTVPLGTVPLYTGPEKAEPQPAAGLFGGAESGDLRTVEYRWDLAGLGLSAGTQLSFHATATDYRPQTGQSEPRRLIVITPEELQDRIAEGQGQILAELARVLKMQQAARTQVESLDIRLAEIGQLGRLDVDHLQAAELNQRQVRTSLTSRSEGAAGVILALLADLENNKVDSPDVRRRMEALLQGIADLDREHLPLVGRDLTAAIKTAQVTLEEGSDGRPSSAVADRLASAGKHQDQVIASLEQMLAELSRWDNYRRFHREISQLLRDQQQVARRSGELGQSTMAKDLKDLRPQERADLNVLAGQQRGLARQLDRIQQGMQRTGEQLRQSDPLAAETVADALAEVQRLAISGQMLNCADHLGRNRIGQALGRQKQIISDLQEVLDILANRREHELARLVEKLSEAEAELAEIERRQADLQKRLEQNARDADEARRRAELQRLGREEAKLQEETERMTRRLQRLLADQAGRATQQAAGQMGQAAECAAGGAAEGACQGATEARESLEEARRQLAQRLREARAELAQEQLARLEDAVQHLHRRQEGVITETERLDSLKRSEGELTRGQTAGLHDLAREQRLLQEETDRMAEKLIGAGAFHLVLSGAGRDMDRAAAMLQRNRTDTTTQQAENDALRRLGLVLEALKADPPGPEPDGGGEGGGGEGGGDGAGGMGGGPGGGVQMLAELKLLKLVQQEINLRTRELQELADAAEGLTDEQRQQYTLLSEEQGRLANLILQLLQTEPQDPEGDVDELPDVGLDEGD